MKAEPKQPFEDDPPQAKALTGQSDQAEELPTRRRQFYYLPILIVAVVIVVLVIVFVDKPVDFEGYIKSSGYAGVLLMGIIGSTSPIWPLPGSWAAFIAGGLGLNPIMLALAAGFGEPIGEITAYMAGYGGQVAVTNWKRYNQIAGWMTRYGAITIFLVSAVPNTFTKFAVVAAGALRYSWWKFFVLCWAGKTIKSFGFAIAGAGFFNVIVNLIERLT